MWLFSLTRTRPCPLRHAQTQTRTHMRINTHSLSWCRTLTVYRRPCKLDNRCQMQTWCACWFDCSAQTAGELWTAEETLIWMETSCHCLLAQLPATLTKTQTLVCKKVLIDKLGGMWGADVREICATGDETQQSSLIPLSIWRRLPKQNAHSQSYTFPTFSTHSTSSVGPEWLPHCNCGGPKATWPTTCSATYYEDLLIKTDTSSVLFLVWSRTAWLLHCLILFLTQLSCCLEAVNWKKSKNCLSVTTGLWR